MAKIHLAGRVAFHRAEHTNCLFSTERSTLKTYIQVTLLIRLYLGIYAYENTYVYAMTISGKKEATDLKESRNGYVEGFEGRKEKEEM